MNIQTQRNIGQTADRMENADMTGKYEKNHYRSLFLYGFDNHVDLNDESLLNLNEEVFYNKLYFNRVESEENIKSKIETMRYVLGVFGFAGCGKSSTINGVLRKMERDNSVQYIRLDFKNAPSLRRLEGPQEKFEQGIKVAINEALTAKYLKQHGEKDGISFVRNITAHFVDQLLKGKETNPIVSSFSDLADHIKEIYNHDRERQYGIRRWIETTDNSDFSHLLRNEIKNKVDIEHKLMYFWEIEKSRFIIFFDNVDRIEHNRQSKVFLAAIDMNNTLADIASFIVALRVENATRPQNETGHESDWIEPILLCEPNVLGGAIPFFSLPKELNKLNPECLNGDLPNNVLDNILLKRMQYYKDFIHNHASSPWFESINDAMENIRKTYVNNLVTELANRNTRIALATHMEFSIYLLTEFEKTKGIKSPMRQINDMSDSERNTMFYEWLVNHGRGANIRLFDPVHTAKRWKKPNSLGIDEDAATHVPCCINYLLLTCIQNLLEMKKQKKTIFCTVSQNLESLGYTELQIRGSAFEMIGENDVVNIIEIRQNEPIYSANDIKADADIWISPRGTVLLKYISVTFTFITEFLKSNKYVNDIHPHQISTLEKLRKEKTSQYSDIGLDILFLTDLLQLHTEALKRLRKKISEEENWIKKYRTFFGFGRNEKLQFERIVESHRDYIHKNEDINAKHKTKICDIYDKLLQQFKENVSHITNNERCPTLSPYMMLTEYQNSIHP